MKKWIIVIFILLGFVAICTCIGFAHTFNSNTATIVSGSLGFLATMIIGILTYALTKKIDSENKRLENLRNKERKSLEKLQDREKKEQYVNDLKLKANPVIFYKNIHAVLISKTTYLISTNESINRLINIPVAPDEKIITMSGSFSFLLEFNSPRTDCVERITVKNCSLRIRNTENRTVYKCSEVFVNPSFNQGSNIRYSGDGNLLCYVELLFSEEKDLVELQKQCDAIINSNNYIVLQMEIVASNSFGLYKEYNDCEFKFIIKNLSHGPNRKVLYEIGVGEHCMWPGPVEYLPNKQKSKK